MQKTASENIIPSGSYDFLNQAHNAFTIRAYYVIISQGGSGRQAVIT